MDWITLQERHFLSQVALDFNNSLIFIENHGNAIVKTEIHGYSSLEENSKDHLFHISDLRQGQTLSKSFLTCDWLSHSQNSQPGQKEISCSQKQSAGVTPLARWRFFPWCSTKGAFLEPNNYQVQWYSLLCRWREIWPSTLCPELCPRFSGLHHGSTTGQFTED